MDGIASRQQGAVRIGWVETYNNLNNLNDSKGGNQRDGGEAAGCRGWIEVLVEGTLGSRIVIWEQRAGQIKSWEDQDGGGSGPAQGISRKSRIGRGSRRSRGSTNFFCVAYSCRLTYLSLESTPVMCCTIYTKYRDVDICIQLLKLPN